MSITLKLGEGPDQETYTFPTPPGVNEKAIIAALQRLNSVEGITLNAAARTLSSTKATKHFFWLASELANVRETKAAAKRLRETRIIHAEVLDYMNEHGVDGVTAAARLYPFDEDPEKNKLQATEFIKDLEKWVGPLRETPHETP